MKMININEIGLVELDHDEAKKTEGGILGVLACVFGAGVVIGGIAAIIEHFRN